MAFILIISIFLILILLFTFSLLLTIQITTRKKSFKKLHIKWLGFEFLLAM